MLISEATERLMGKIYPLIYFILPRLPSRISQQGLNESQFSILLLLQDIIEKNEQIIQVEIAKIITHSSTTISRQIDNLGKKALVIRKPVRNIESNRERTQLNKRMTLVEITPLGTEILLKEKNRRKKEYEKILACLTPQERKCFINYLEKIVVGHRRGRNDFC